jgi:radical SAM superfamily enzyme YgiQ (UPF0313 family)
VKIQLIHPPHPQACEDRLDAPLGLLCIAAVLLRVGHNVVVTDLSSLPREQWNIEYADLYGITSYIPTMNLSSEIARLCKQRNSNAIVVGGGANFTDLFHAGLENLLPSEFDSFVIGRGEEAILDLISDYPKVKRFYERQLSKDLDAYPNPAYFLVDLDSYSREIGNQKSVTMLTSRGCPFGCAFCTIDHNLCFRSPEYVVKEIQQLKDQYGISSFNFQDDTFLLDKKRTKKLLSLLKPLNIQFRCHGRVSLDSIEDYQMLKEAGCAQICWGIESGSQRMLDRMNKKVSVVQNMEVIHWAQFAGLLDRVFLVVGFPGETRETLEETKRFIEAANPSQVFASMFQPYPGTRVWKNPESFGVRHIHKDFTRYLQVYGDGKLGQSNIDTEWASREEMDGMVGEFSSWLSKRSFRGTLQKYEKLIRK